MAVARLERYLYGRAAHSAALPAARRSRLSVAQMASPAQARRS
jgi:hypothetical protein